jgi:hypothetical protein
MKGLGSILVVYETLHPNSEARSCTYCVGETAGCDTCESVRCGTVQQGCCLPYPRPNLLFVC